MEAIGYEGLCGLTYCTILLVIFNIIPCTSELLCSEGYVENTIFAFQQLGDSPILAVLWIAFFVSIGLFNWTGVATTNYSSALARSTIDTSRTILVWVISIIIGWEVFIWLQLIGFVFLVLGTIIYNEVLILPFWGFKESVIKHRVYDRRRRGLSEDDDLGPGYIGSSPGKAYDSSIMNRRASDMRKSMQGSLIEY